MREYHVRICEELGVKFPGSTRHLRLMRLVPASHDVRSTPKADIRFQRNNLQRWATRRHRHTDSCHSLVTPLARRFTGLSSNRQNVLVSTRATTFASNIEFPRKVLKGGSHLCASN